MREEQSRGSKGKGKERTETGRNETELWSKRRTTLMNGKEYGEEMEMGKKKTCRSSLPQWGPDIPISVPGGRRQDVSLEEYSWGVEWTEKTEKGGGTQEK